MARKHLIIGISLALFASIFACFLIAAAWFYFTDGKNMTIESFAPGAPALFLGFLSRNQFRSYRAARKLEAWKARQSKPAVTES